MLLKQLIFNSFYLGGGCGGHEITDIEQFLIWAGVVVIKQLTSNTYYFQRLWWSLKS